MAYALKTDDSASRRVIVKNLSPITKQADIIIHFPRRGNGGGEVDSVHKMNEINEPQLSHSKNQQVSLNYGFLLLFSSHSA